MGALIYFVFAIVLNGVCGSGRHQEGPESPLRSAFDQDLYEDVLNSEMCQAQLQYLETNALGLRYIDASGKIPAGISGGNYHDLGDYHQCLGIKTTASEMQFQGKYCAIRIHLLQESFTTPTSTSITLPTIPSIPTSPTTTTTTQSTTTTETTTTTIIDLPSVAGTTPSDEDDDLDEEGNIIIDAGVDAKMPPWSNARAMQFLLKNDEFEKMERFSRLETYVFGIIGMGQRTQERIFPQAENLFVSVVGICVPHVCTAREAVQYVQERLNLEDITYDEYYCRLPNDKPFVAADYVAIVLLSLIGLLIIISTTYDLIRTFVTKRPPVPLDILLLSFSVYTNTRRLLTFNSSPGALECLDGIRAISMMWVVVGHTYSMSLLAFIHNGLDTLNWIEKFTSTWINSAPITVDTFFMLSGILAVYTVIGKTSRGRFIRTLHLFYLNRLLRMFPLLATVVLLQASLFNHFADGPFWLNQALATENCRTYWWSALLHIQNYVNPLKICVVQSWYLSVDMQLYFLCPLALVLMFGRQRIAWSILIFFLLLSIVGSATYSYLYQFSAALNNINRLTEFSTYIRLYYVNTLTRAPPFFVGMIYGYLLYLSKNKKINLPKVTVILMWVLSLGMMAFCIFSMYPVVQRDFQGQQFDNFLNAFMRPIWAAALGWLIFACIHGYGGPVNWFLSLQIWKLPARLSYAVYLIHVPIIYTSLGTWVKTYYFAESVNFYRFLSDLSLSFFFAFILCIAIDSPCSTLQKLLTGAKKRPAKTEQNLDPEVVTTEDGYITDPKR